MKLKPEWVMYGALAVGLLLRLSIAAGDAGIYWPDEVYQSLEPAHRLVFGYGFVAWEFIEGARNWALPGLVAGLMALAKGLGLTAPAQYLMVVRGTFAVGSVGCAYGVWRLARALGAKPWAAASGAAAAAVYSLGLYFGHRAMSENASALTVVLGLWLVVESSARSAVSGGAGVGGGAGGGSAGGSSGGASDLAAAGSSAAAPPGQAPATPAAGPSPRRAHLLLLTGVSLLGLSVLLRLQTGLFCVALLVWQLARRRWREALESFGVLCAWAFCFGLLDHLTWASAPGAKYGGWFHSALKYLEFNLVQGRGAAWGTAGFGYYAATLWHAMPALTVVLGVGALLAWRRAPLVFFSSLAFFVAHSLIPHKELRFLLPMLPLCFALAATGFSLASPDELKAKLATLAGAAQGARVRLELWWTRALQALPLETVGTFGVAGLAVFGGWSGLNAKSLTFGDLGAYPDRPQASAWDDFGPANRLLEKAGTLSDLCGLRAPAHLAWVGGYTYLHKDVPLYLPQVPPDGRFNYAVVPKGTGLPPVATDGPLELVKVANGCRPDPSFSWRLP